MDLQVWIGLLVLIVYCLTIISLIFVVITENRNPLKTVAWIVLLLFPFLGLFSYLIFGQDNRKQRIISRKIFRRIKKPIQPLLREQKKINVPDDYRPLIHLLRKSKSAVLHQKNQIRIFTSGKYKLKQLLADIRNAKHHIHFQYYIIDDDEIGKTISDLLIQQAQRGIIVRVIYDDVGSWKTPKSFFKHMTDAGVNVCPFLPVHFPAFTSKINYRNHRKIVVIDGEIGYFGGMNIANRYFVENKQKNTPWRDNHFRITGSAVHSLQSSFSVDWYVMTQEIIEGKTYYPQPKQVDTEKCPLNTMQISTSDPVGIWRTQLQVYLYAISNAKQYIYLQTPYFLPTEPLNHALQIAALGGIDIRLMIPDESDTPIVTKASNSFLEDLMRAGVKIYRYKGGFLHTKSIVTDDSFCYIGSGNLDFRSFEHNYEINASVYDEDFAARMKKIFLSDMKQCTRIDFAEWQKRPHKIKFIESFMRIFSPLL